MGGDTVSQVQPTASVGLDPGHWNSRQMLAVISCSGFLPSDMEFGRKAAKKGREAGFTE